MYNYGGQYAALNAYGTQYANASMDYWSRSLFQRLTALFEFYNLPTAETNKYAWDKDALKYGLYMRGYLAVFESKKYGVVPVPCTITGYGLQFQPTGAMVNTPYFQFSKPLKIGIECELLKLTPDYTGVYDIVTKYAAELKEIETSIRAAARNSRLAYVLIGHDDKTARTLKNVREKILNGDDAIIDEKLMKTKGVNGNELPWYQFDRDVKASYILNDLLEARRTTLIDFYREIGVRMLDDKKERMITGEVAAGNAETFIRSEVWAETLKESVEKVNNMFGTNIIAKPSIPDFGGANNAL